MERYGTNAAVGAGIGLAIGAAAAWAHKMQMFGVKEGGRIVCLNPNFVKPNPRVVRTGWTIAATADVPTNYAFKRALFASQLISAPVALGVGGTLGAAGGAAKAWWATPQNP